MFRQMRSVRPLDAAIAVVAVLVLALAVFLGFSYIQQQRSVAGSTAVSRAIEELKAKIRANPGNVQLRMDLAQAYSVAGKDREANGQYLAILKANKNFIPAISGLGFQAAKAQDWQQSEEYWKRVIVLMADVPAGQASKQWETANFYMGTALLEQKKYQEAIGYFKAALRQDSSASDSHYLLAEAYKGLDAKDEYGAELQYALAFDPKMPEANYEFGLLSLEKGDTATAAEHFRTSVDAAPGRPEPKNALDKLGPFSKRFNAAKDLATKDPAQALEEARIAVALDPKNVDALTLVGDLQMKTKKKSDAAATFSRVLEIQPDNKTAQSAIKKVTNGK